MAEHIPEDVIAKIFQRLPAKSLIRFTSVSKRWRLIILQDPHFAASYYQIASHNKTLRHSVCFRIYLDSHCFFESQTTSSSSLVVKRDLRCSFKKPHRMVYVYCSCRCLVHASVNGKQKIETKLSFMVVVILYFLHGSNQVQRISLSRVGQLAVAANPIEKLCWIVTSKTAKEIVTAILGTLDSVEIS
ncbi:hypothetical protein ACLB2K_041158 [Fragaria x ananassa]